ncbi:hypothetical protein MTR67_034848 [Solanum verrucosum]|uniref:MULE transposase domain-containing protein n=1 Tax=Solanum verrucosum TaxID=315347 RepID=A0AAF0ZKW3_SOLVR|nr:hypothetical protein MTR67_034848 [Solanum verrucosum]
MVDQMDGFIALLEYTGPNEESLGTFNKEIKRGVEERDRGVEEGGKDVHFPKPTTTEPAAFTEPTIEPAAFTEPPTTKTTSSSQPASQPTNTETFGELESQYSTENSSESDHENLFNEGEVEYNSDVHEEGINLRAERRTYQRSKRRERIPNDPEEIPIGEVGPNLGFDETDVVDKSLKGKVVGDEPIYCSSNAFSIEINTDDEVEPRSSSRRMIFDKSTEKVVWQLGMVFEDVREFREVVTKYSLQKGVQLEKYINEPKKDIQISGVDQERVENPCWKNHWRARGEILKGIMGDHVLEFGRILYYRDEMLRTNPGSTCVVKVDDSEGSGRLGVTKGQLLCDVAKHANNQMLPIVWGVVEYENKNTWTWFLKLLIHDLELGDGKDYIIISDMQKGLDSVLEDLLPEVEQRMCPRHILANWAKNWRDLQRRNQFWKCAKSTFEGEMKANLAMLELLGTKKIVEDLLYYKVQTWCKMYFRTDIKCDSIDNNMSESFNAWIVGPRHKITINMLEDIRVKDHASPTNVARPSKAKGRPRQLLGRGKNATPIIEAPPKATERGNEATSTYEVVQEPARGRGRPRKTLANGMTIPMPRRTLFAKWFENPTSYQLPVSPTPYVASQSSARNSNAPTSYDALVEPPAKRPKTVGMGVFVAEDGFTAHNHGLASSRIIHTGSRKPIRSADVTGDLGYKPRTRVRWKGKVAVTAGHLEEIRVNKRKNLSSSQPKKAWK